MINGVCITYLDDYKHIKWPTRFVAVPKKDSLIMSNDGKHELPVNGITHKIDPDTGIAGIIVRLAK